MKKNFFFLLEGVKDPLRQRKLEESRSQKAQKLKKVTVAFVATFPSVGWKGKADRLRAEQVWAASQIRGCRN